MSKLLLFNRLTTKVFQMNDTHTHTMKSHFATQQGLKNIWIQHYFKFEFQVLSLFNYFQKIIVEITLLIEVKKK